MNTRDTRPESHRTLTELVALEVAGQIQIGKMPSSLPDFDLCALDPDKPADSLPNKQHPAGYSGVKPLVGPTAHHTALLAISDIRDFPRFRDDARGSLQDREPVPQQRECKRKHALRVHRKLERRRVNGSNQDGVYRTTILDSMRHHAVEGDAVSRLEHKLVPADLEDECPLSTVNVLLTWMRNVCAGFGRNRRPWFQLTPDEFDLTLHVWSQKFIHESCPVDEHPLAALSPNHKLSTETVRRAITITFRVEEESGHGYSKRTRNPAQCGDRGARNPALHLGYEAARHSYCTCQRVHREATAVPEPADLLAKFECVMVDMSVPFLPGCIRELLPLKFRSHVNSSDTFLQ